MSRARRTSELRGSARRNVAALPLVGEGRESEGVGGASMTPTLPRGEGATPMDLSDLIDRNAAFAPDKPAIRFQGRTLTYGGLAQRIAAARALKSQLGVGRGDRVAILAANHPDYLVLLYACARLGAMLVPLNWRLAVPEQVFILADASVKALVVEESFAAVIAPLRGPARGPRRRSRLQSARRGVVRPTPGVGQRRRPQSAVDISCPLLIVYTSGTTGRPKGAVLRQEALLWNGVMSQHMHGLTAEDHVLTVLPFFHVGGLNIQTTPALQLGATVTLHARFAPDATLAAIARDRPTLTVLVPATIQALIEHPRWHDTDVSSLRAVATGSTLVPQNLIDAVTGARRAGAAGLWLDRNLPDRGLHGSAATGAVPARPACPASCARPAVVDDTGAEAAPGDVGEVLVRGPNVFFEYWGNEAATREALRDGWYRTGDIGRRDADGYFFVHDRKKNMIISGGENIYPAEVERVLRRASRRRRSRGDRPARSEVAGGAGRLRGAARRCGDRRRRRDSSLRLAQLARFKIPRYVVFVDSLPRNAMGKVQHFN